MFPQPSLFCSIFGWITSKMIILINTLQLHTNGFIPVQEISPIEYVFRNYGHYRNYVCHNKFILCHNAQVSQRPKIDQTNSNALGSLFKADPEIAAIKISKCIFKGSQNRVAIYRNGLPSTSQSRENRPKRRSSKSGSHATHGPTTSGQIGRVRPTRYSFGDWTLGNGRSAVGAPSGMGGEAK